MLNNEPKIIVSDLNVFYGNKQAIFDINMSINSKEVTAFIGPSGCGKSTCLLYTSPSPRDVEESRMPSSA